MARIRVCRPVRLLVSSLAQAPAVVGWLRPVVLVPAGALAGFPPEQVEALLLHELAHIRRLDWLVQMTAQALRVTYWFNPLLWVACHRLRLESEVACDDGDVAVTRVPGILLARYRGQSPESARSYFIALWARIRPALAGLDAVLPRIWTT